MLSQAPDSWPPAPNPCSSAPPQRPALSRHRVHSSPAKCLANSVSSPPCCLKPLTTDHRPQTTAACNSLKTKNCSSAPPQPGHCQPNKQSESLTGGEDDKSVKTDTECGKVVSKTSYQIAGSRHSPDTCHQPLQVFLTVKDMGRHANHGAVQLQRSDQYLILFQVLLYLGRCVPLETEGNDA